MAAPAATLALRHELGRKALHIVSAIAPVAYSAGVPRRLMLEMLGILCVAAIGAEIARSRWPRVRRTFLQITGPLLRAHEHDRWSGATWMLVAFLGAVAVFPGPAAVTAMWAVSVGDASAAIAGRTIGRTRLAPSGKTLEGSFACAVASAFGALFLGRVPIAVATAAGMTAALAEWPRRPLDDNLRIALAVGACVTLMVSCCGAWLFY